MFGVIIYIIDNQYLAKVCFSCDG